MLEEVPKAIRPLTLLRTLDIGENQIEMIRSKDFDGLHNLYGLRLAGNGIERLQDDVFQAVSTLQVCILTLLGLGLIKINTLSANFNNPRPLLILKN
jgi:hypothetical protein